MDGNRLPASFRLTIVQRALIVVGLVALVTACGMPPATDEPSSPGESEGARLRQCGEVGLPTAPEEHYRDTPKYVGNEMPVEAVRAWAMQQPGYVSIWIDREHNGWVAVSFSEDAAARQQEVEERFQGEGVVVVPVDWTAESLAELERRIAGELTGLVPILGTHADVERGVVGLQLQVLDEEHLETIEETVDTDRVCVEGLEPEEVVPAGPQPLGGGGWRLLADEKGIGFPYQVGLAWDEASLEELVSSIPGAEGIQVGEVDFKSEVVVWFGAVYSGSCPNIRLDDVVIADDVIHADLVETDNAMACTADANPHTYLVAVERRLLPAPPFHVQLRPDGVGGDRLLVTADLRPAGAVALRGEVRPDPDHPLPEPERSGTIIEPGYAWDYEIELSCGIEVLGEINGYHWVASAPIPPSWVEATAGASAVIVQVVLHEGPDPYVEVTFEGETLVYTVGEEGAC